MTKFIGKNWMEREREELLNVVSSNRDYFTTNFSAEIIVIDNYDKIKEIFFVVE